MSGLPNITVNIHFANHVNYLHALVIGVEDTLEVSITYWKQIIKECVKRGFSKLIVEENFTSDPDTYEMFEIGSLIAQQAIQYNIKIAFIDRNVDHFIMNQFGETVAINRGAHIKICQSIQEAKQWLEL